MDFSAWLIIVIIIFSVFLLGGLVMIVIAFGHPDDKNQAYFPKIITIFSLWLAFAILLILPYDIAASRTESSLIRVDILWQIVYITLAVFVVLIIPYAFFFYESDEDEEKTEKGCLTGQKGEALKMTFGFLAAFLITLGIMYAFLNRTDIPVQRVSQSSYNKLLITPIRTNTSIPLNLFLNNVTACPENVCARKLIYWEIPISFPLFLITFVAFLGWFFFCMFAGVGFISLPFDFIQEWIYRPTPITARVYQEECGKLADRAKILLDGAEKLLSKYEIGDGGKEKKGLLRVDQDARDLRSLENHYFQLKKDHQLLHAARQLRGGTVIFYFFKLIFGIVGFIISLFWILHIFIYMLPNRPAHPFLNDFFIKLEEGVPGFPLFGVVFFAFFAFYLLVAVVVGNFRLGVRCLCFKVYPMEVGNTMMNSFLFNSWIILFCSLPAVQFCVYAFPLYARETQADVMFGQQIRYMRFFRYFFNHNVFIIALLVFSLLTFLYMLVCPKNKTDEIEKKLDELAKSSSTSLNDIRK